MLVPQSRCSVCVKAHSANQAVLALRRSSVVCLRGRFHASLRHQSAARPILIRTKQVVAAASAASGGDGGSMGPGSGGTGGGGDSGGSFEGPHPLRRVTVLFALFIAVGGVMGYMKKKSAKSLTAGLLSGLILLLCAKSMVGASMVGSARVAFGVFVALAIVMTRRFLNTKAVFPPGVVAFASSGMAIAFLVVGL